MRRAPRILLTAGEPSGDKLGAGLARALLARRPDIELYGMGGPQMEAAGVRLIQQMSEVSVVGLLEVVSHLPVLRRAMARLAGSLDEERPDLHVPIDFPDFNLRLTERSNRAGVPVVYFVSPQIWAWRRGRVRAIRRLVRRMLVLFPFEIEFYERAGVPVSFVGHPMAEEPATGLRDRAELCRIAGLDPGRRIVALLPGSRKGEVSRLLPILIETVRLLERDRRGLQYLVPLAPGLSPEVVERQLIDATGEFVVHAGDFPEILTVCEAGLVAAGTASLEAAVVGLPMAVFYRMRPFSHLVGKFLVQLDDVALPNLIAGQRVVPELIQGESHPERLAAELGRLLDDPAERERMRVALHDVQRRLGGVGVYERAADAILEEIDELGDPEVAAPPVC